MIFSYYFPPWLINSLQSAMKRNFQVRLKSIETEHINKRDNIFMIGLTRYIGQKLRRNDFQAKINKNRILILLSYLRLENYRTYPMGCIKSSNMSLQNSTSGLCFKIWIRRRFPQIFSSLGNLVQITKLHELTSRAKGRKQDYHFS